MTYTLALVPCTGQKDPDLTEGAAEDIWVGAHFQYTLAHVEMMYDRVLILSYKYGLISPKDNIETYDLDLRSAKPRAKIRWWFMVREQLIKLAKEDPPSLVGIYTGWFFRDRIIREFVRNDVLQIIVPWEGKSIGQRLSAVFDAEPPFDPEKVKKGEYKIDLNANGEVPTSLYLPPETKITEPIVWEE